MKRIPVIILILLPVCILATSCQKGPRPAAPAPVDSPEAKLGLQKRQEFDKLINKGINCLQWAERAEIRETHLLKVKAPDSEEVEQIVRAQRGFLEQAEGAFREAVRLDRNSMAARQGLCQAAAKLGKYDETIKQGLIVLEKAPSRMLIYRYIAVAYQRKGSGLEGRARIDYYEKAVQIILDYAPRDRDSANQAQMYTYLGEICLELARLLDGPERLEQCDRIIKVVGEYLNLHPDNPFHEDMQLLVDVAGEIKADFESGYE